MGSHETQFAAPKAAGPTAGGGAENYVDFRHTIPRTNPGTTQLRQAVVKALTQPTAERRADPVIDASPATTKNTVESPSSILQATQIE
jgi:hypothetical protein